MRVVALAGLLVTLLASGATARNWPTPAAGSSASGDPEVVFTFDDGPNAVITPKVLDILAQHNVKAVFFLVGQMTTKHRKKVPEIVGRILREGHIVANHTMSHADLCRTTTDAAREIDEGDAAIRKVAGVEPVWFRAPYGSRCDSLDAQLAERRINHFHWDLDPQEWRSGNAKRTVRYITWHLARTTGRVVVLLHDIHPATVRALPEILTWIEQENVRRKATGRRPIRIVQAPQLAAEQISPALSAWVDQATLGARNLPGTIASLLP
ncbi:MAG: polysaccharide deacetylase family protein [Kofleriaceae bacterium]